MATTSTTKEQTKPKRIQYRRGIALPTNTKRVTRGSRWGNPFTVEGIRRGLVTHGYDFSTNPGGPGFDAYIKAGTNLLRPPLSRLPSKRLLHTVAVAWHREFLEAWRQLDPEAFNRWIAPLRGMNLACYCDLSLPCHVDTLLDLANSRES